MPPAIKAELLQEAVDTFQATGSNYTQAALILGIPRPTVQSRIEQARRRGITPRTADPNDPLQLKSQIKRLQSDLREAQQERVDHAMIKHKIIGLTREVNDVTPPGWMKSRETSHSQPGVPTLLVSDLHWGEVVDGRQINGVNQYNLDIAHSRIRHLAERAVHLCKIISPKMEYPGLVLPLGGDMFSGNIHDELTATNELNSMPCVLDLYGTLVWMIKFFLDHFPAVFIPCVTGNHGRDTKKIWAKDRHHTSFDWLLYCLLAKYFEQDKRVTFLIPDGPDAYYQVYSHTYLLTHGDQFKGGDSMIGALGPLCVAPDTKVLLNNLRYVRAGDLQVGDKLLAFDEEAPTGKRRLFREAVVEETRRLSLECYEVQTDDGCVTIASVDHPWLTRSGVAHSWSLTKNLRIGSQILTLGKPWEQGDSYSDGYIAALLDGEGSLESNGRVKFTQQNNACLSTALTILNEHGIPYRVQSKKVGVRGYEECYDIVLFGGNGIEARGDLRANVWKLLGQTRPERIIQEKFANSWKNVSIQIAKTTRVIGLRYVGEREVAAFSTSTRTFIGNGMFMHNTRGDQKKRSRNMQIHMGYDTMLCGHWHQYIQLQRLIVNGSLKGYDEYAYRENFPYEPAQQALWLTHPKYRITYRMPVQVQQFKDVKVKPWVSIVG